MEKQDITEKILLVMMFKKGVNISKTKKILRKFADVKIACILNIKSVVMELANIGTQTVKIYLI